MTKRQGNYDVLRFVSTFFVIVLHINAHYYTMTDNGVEGQLISFINIITRISVPCFVMISGAFILNNPKNIDFKFFYTHVFQNTVLPFLVISFVLLGASTIKAIVIHEDLLAPLKAFFIGDYFNLWFMFMLFGLYFFTPIIIMVKEKISNRIFCITSFIWLGFSIWFQSNSEHLVSYSFGVVFAYMGYYLVGNAIFENTKKKTHSKMLLCFVGSVVCIILTFFIRQFYSIGKYLWNPYVSFFSPTIVVASIFIFLTISNWNVKVSFGKLPHLLFYVYLFHTAIYQIIFSVLKSKIIYNTFITILVVSMVTFLISFVVAVVFWYIWRYFIKFILKNKN